MKLHQMQHSQNYSKVVQVKAMRNVLLILGEVWGGTSDLPREITHRCCCCYWLMMSLCSR